MKNTTNVAAYAVISHYWNGSTFALDRDDICVFMTREAAATHAATLTLGRTWETEVEIIEVSLFAN